MGGAPRQAFAATFPPGRYWCLLDELPTHLLPAGSVPTVRRDRRREWVLNPLARILPDGQVPRELASSPAALEGLALQGTIAWVPRIDPDSLLPFWLSPRLAEAMQAASFGNNLESILRDDELSVLVAAGLLQTVEQVDHEREQWHELIARSAEMFQTSNYVPIRNLIHPFHVAALRRYFRYKIRRGMIYLGDEQCPGRYGVHNDSVARFFHHHLANTVSAIAGEIVKPSYVYSACYVSGAELKKHVDREQCEFSVTLAVDFSPEPRRETPWPVRLETPRGQVSLYQALGDGLVYRGTRVPHYRDSLAEGRTSTSMFFHYVPESFTGSLD